MDNVSIRYKTVFQLFHKRDALKPSYDMKYSERCTVYRTIRQLKGGTYNQGNIVYDLHLPVSAGMVFVKG